MVEHPDPSKSLKLAKTTPRWVSFQIDPVTSRPVHQRLIPSGLLSPDKATRRRTALGATESGNLISTILMDPSRDVREAAVCRIVELLMADGCHPGFALRVATTCHILNRSGNQEHAAVASHLAKKLIDAAHSLSSPLHAFAQLVTALLIPASLDLDSRKRARNVLASDDRLATILNFVAKQFLINDDADITATGIFIDFQAIPNPERGNLDINVISAILACGSPNAGTTTKGVNTLTALCNDNPRSPFGLRVLGFIATNPSPNIANTQLGDMEFKDEDIASLAPWLVLRFASHTALSLGGPTEKERKADLGGAKWARISQPLLEKLDQYLATGNPLAILGTCRLLRALTIPEGDRELKESACRIATAQLGALANIRKAAGLTDQVLASEISAQINFLHKNLSDETTLFRDGNGEATLVSLSSRGEFAVAKTVELATKFLRDSARNAIISNIIGQIAYRVNNCGYSEQQAEQAYTEGLCSILDGLTPTIHRIRREQILNVGILDVFQNINLVVGASLTPDVYNSVGQIAISALKHAQINLHPAHRQHFMSLYLERLTNLAMADIAQPNAAHFSLLNSLLNSPPTPESTLRAQGEKFKFVALSPVTMKRLTDHCCKILCKLSSQEFRSAFDVRNCLLDLIINVAGLANNDIWGSDDSKFSAEEVTTICSACAAVCDSPHASTEAKAKAARLQNSLQS